MPFAKIRSFFFITCLTLIQCWSCVPAHRDQEESRQSAPSMEEKEMNAPSDWQFLQRAFPYNRIDHTALSKAFQYRQSKIEQQINVNGSSRNSATWQFGGPTNIGGRVTDIEISSDSIHILYAGSASGGIFMSDDMGTTWDAIFDQAEQLSIGDMAIAPSNQAILYVGTGEANAGGGSIAYDGNGMYKTLDGGTSWIHLGLEDIGSVGKVIIHPQNPDIAYVGAMGYLFANNPDRGVFKTEDGGTTWENVLYINDSTGVIDLVLDPTNPNTIYAAAWQRIRRIDRQMYGGPSSGIYKTTNGGITWEKISASFLGASGRIGLAISASNPDILVAAVCTPGGSLDAIYKTTNAGVSWDQLNLLGIDAPAYSYWFGRIYIDPTNPDILYYTSLDMYKSWDGGITWQTIFPFTHADQHTLCFHPENTNQLFLGNDGGVYYSWDGGSSYTKFNTLPITQFYSCELDFMFPERLYGGAQDNSTVRTLTGSTEDWDQIYFGDGFRVLVDPTNNTYVYAEFQYGNIARSINGGNSFITAISGISNAENKNWNTPIEFNPKNPSTLFTGAQRVYKSSNRAMSWTPISPNLTGNLSQGNISYGSITSISVSPIDDQIILAGTDDGHVQVTENGGETWTDISGSLPQRWVTAVETDPLDRKTAYVSFSGFRFGSDMAHLYMTPDLGQTWVDISGDLPDIPVNDIIVTPIYRNIYIATDVGVFTSPDKGTNWDILGTALPNTIISDITYHPTAHVLVAATYGRGMYTLQVEEEVTALSTPKQEDKEIQVFPNPTSGHTTIRLPELPGDTYSISICDVTGKAIALLFSHASNSREITFDATTLPCGIYFLMISAGPGVNMRITKFIKT